MAKGLLFNICKGTILDRHNVPFAYFQKRTGRMATAFLVEMHKRPGLFNIQDYTLFLKKEPRFVFGNTTLRMQITI